MRNDLLFNNRKWAIPEVISKAMLWL